MRFIIALLLIIFLHPLCLSPGFAVDKVTLQLPWSHQFQFAGYYAAISQGYYRDSGFDVTILEGGANVDPIDQVVKKNAQYGISSSELILRRAEGDPVVVLAAIFQHSPLVFIAPNGCGIRHPHDFIGKRIIVSKSRQHGELHAMLIKDGVSLDQFEIVKSYTAPEDIKRKDVDVFSAYVSNEPYILDKSNIPFTVISPSSYGIDFYGDSLFTSEDEISNFPERARRFREASLKGWQYAMEHQEEMVDVFLEEYGAIKSREHLLYEAAKMQELILPKMIEIGHMHLERWEHMAETFSDVGLLNKEFSTDGFLYSEFEDSAITQLFYRIAFCLFLIILLVIVVALVLMVTNRRLKREADEHQKTSLALQKSSQQLKEYQKQTEQFSLSAASMLSIKDEKELFKGLSDTIVEYSDYQRVLISLFHENPPRRELIGYAGVTKEVVEKVKRTSLSKYWYDQVFEVGVLLGQCSYYVPHTMKDILNQDAIVYGEGHKSTDSDQWHPEDNLFVKMVDDEGNFIGVISVDDSKSGLKPTSDIVRPLEIYASLISQIIIMKRAQQHRQLLEDQLRQAQKMEAIGNLTGGIAHDFNNVLGVIIGHVEMGLRIQPENEQYKSHLSEIKAASHRARDIVQHLLTFSRKRERELKTIKIRETLEDSLRFIRSTIPTTIQISSEISLEDQTVFADSTQIYQIVLNLCTNSAHAMEEHGGELIVSAHIEHIASFVEMSSKPMPAGDYVKLTIQDTGHGIDEDVAHLIFDPYFTTKGVGKGTGMGLAIVHGIVESHDGLILVKSKRGEGCKVEVYLPVCAGEVSYNEIEPISCISKGTERLMLIDDEVALLNILGRQLEKAGYTVETYENPETAIGVFKMDPDGYDLVITDMTMPPYTGEVLAKKMLDIKPDLPIFLCTGYSDKIDEERAIEVGFTKFLIKPVPFRKLTESLREVLGNNEGDN